ncbi:MAG: hypothetical protein ACREX8_04850 [Gammaproteobacteria bacterium]
MRHETTEHDPPAADAAMTGPPLRAVRDPHNPRWAIYPGGAS